MKNTAAKNTADINPIETREWLESLDDVVELSGPVRAARLRPAQNLIVRVAKTTRELELVI